METQVGSKTDVEKVQIFSFSGFVCFSYQHFCKTSTFVSNHSCPWWFPLFLMMSRKELAHDVMYTAVLHAALVYDLLQSWLK